MEKIFMKETDEKYYVNGSDGGCYVFNVLRFNSLNCDLSAIFEGGYAGVYILAHDAQSEEKGLEPLCCGCSYDFKSEFSDVEKFKPLLDSGANAICYAFEPSEELRKVIIKDIIAEYGMDQSKLAMKWKDKDRLIKHIIETSERRVTKGNAFRDNGGNIY